MKKHPKGPQSLPAHIAHIESVEVTTSGNILALALERGLTNVCVHYLTNSSSSLRVHIHTPPITYHIKHLYLTDLSWQEKS